jgi:hypothetical protein
MLYYYQGVLEWLSFLNHKTLISTNNCNFNLILNSLITFFLNNKLGYKMLIID